MAETVNIARMAELLSEDIFEKFKWKRCGTTNKNWACSKISEHETPTHPSDLVMSYEEPYKLIRTYVNFDLKSYAKGTITHEKIGKALADLGRTMTCIEVSEAWQRLFTDASVPSEFVGVLFVYNHDGEYDKDFDKLIEKIDHNSLEIPENSKLIVLGPNQIKELDNIATDISQMQASKEIPLDSDDYWFYYPNLSRTTNIRPTSKLAANLEMLTGPWTTLRYIDSTNPSNHGYVIHYGRSGENKEEFLYLIDHIQHYQFLSPGCKISIRLLDPAENALTRFEQAIEHYVGERGGDRELRELLGSIKVRPIKRTTANFSQEAIGMERRS